MKTEARKATVQRIRIANALGFKNVNAKCWRGHYEGYEMSIPDFLHDLNAMQEAEKILTPDQHKRYRRTQFEVATGVAVGAINHIDKDTRLQLFRVAAIAPCHTRAEAFLRTLNLCP